MKRRHSDDHQRRILSPLETGERRATGRLAALSHVFHGRFTFERAIVSLEGLTRAVVAMRGGRLLLRAPERMRW
jgi:hypothetical protein